MLPSLYRAIIYYTNMSHYIKKTLSSIYPIYSTYLYLHIYLQKYNVWMFYFSNNLQSYLSNQDTDKAIFEYKLLCDMSLSLLHSKCTHLTAFLIETTKHWHGILKSIISRYCNKNYYIYLIISSPLKYAFYKFTVLLWGPYIQ